MGRWNVTDATLGEIMDIAVREGLPVGSAWIEYGGCGSHCIYLTDEDPSGLTAEDRAREDAEDLTRAEVDEAVRVARENRDAELIAEMEDPTRGWD